MCWVRFDVTDPQIMQLLGFAIFGIGSPQMRQ